MTRPLSTLPDNDPLAFRVRTFTALIEEVGRLCARLGSADLLFRGQTKAYVQEDGQHAVRPRVYRNGDLAEGELRALLTRIQSLNEALLLHQRYARSSTGVEALFAHYERHDTRMLDVTQVLHIAASFALAAVGDEFDGPAVVYALDVLGGRPKPESGELGKALVAATTEAAAIRPMRQAAWVIWRHNAGAEVVDFGGLVRGAFLIDKADRATFWDCHGPLDHAWLMCGDAMSDEFRRTRA